MNNSSLYELVVWQCLMMKILFVQNQITDLKQSMNPSSSQLQSMLLDPAINLLFVHMKREMDSCRTQLDQSQKDLAAWKFTPDRLDSWHCLLQLDSMSYSSQLSYQDIIIWTSFSLQSMLIIWAVWLLVVVIVTSYFVMCLQSNRQAADGKVSYAAARERRPWSYRIIRAAR